MIDGGGFKACSQRILSIGTVLLLFALITSIARSGAVVEAQQATGAITLPMVGEAVEIETGAPLSKASLASLEANGLRLLGTVAANRYAFVRTAYVGNGSITGDSISEKIRNAEAITAEKRASTGVSQNARAGVATGPVFITFHEGATAAEVREVLGGEPEFSLPADGNASIGVPESTIMDALDSGLLFRAMNAACVANVEERGTPETTNLASRNLSGANPTPYGTGGSGVVVGIWDGGPVGIHQDFESRVTNQQTALAVSTHATHVCGTIVGAGLGVANARGFASLATVRSYDFNGIIQTERNTAKQSFYQAVDNHSWGLAGDSSDNGTYGTDSQDFDRESRLNLMLGVKSAGNWEGSNTAPWQSVNTSSASKNILVVGATNDSGTSQNINWSCRGPTDDGRIKPDVAANGYQLNSTYPNNTYASISGTSMAAPSVTGCIALLEEHHRNLNSGLRMAPDVARLIAMHTAQDIGAAGPDYKFGYGLVKADAACDLAQADYDSISRHIVRDSMIHGQQKDYVMPVPAGQLSLKVSLTWLDMYGTGTVSQRLIHDLDLEMIAPDGITVHYPWSLDPANPTALATRAVANHKDNFEQVIVDNPVAGNWTIRVKGTSISSITFPVQGFVLATSHAVNRNMERQVATTTETAIPDNDAVGLEYTFTMTDTGKVKSLRVYLDIKHERRGDIVVELEHLGDIVVLETTDTQTPTGLYAIYPDTRSADFAPSALDVFINRNAKGVWKLRIKDVVATKTGAVRMAALEVDGNGAGALHYFAGALPNGMLCAGSFNSENGSAAITCWFGSASFPATGTVRKVGNVMTVNASHPLFTLTANYTRNAGSGATGTASTFYVPNGQTYVATITTAQ
ncbi:MAG: S8 family serine peptidase [Planctomycetes bacterium]|nr:S8 family serine peptidase [Planctomycetota bacterium]NUQ35155.1 S8 family serine peptidase [Planctomycetaceae bacterium]